MRSSLISPGKAFLEENEDLKEELERVKEEEEKKRNEVVWLQKEFEEKLS